MKPTLRVVERAADKTAAQARRTVMVVADELRVQKRVSRIMRAVGLDVVAGANSPALQHNGARTPLHLLVFQARADADPATLAAFIDASNAVPTIILSESCEQQHCTQLVSRVPRASYAILMGAWDDGDLLRTARKMLEEDLFGAEKYLNWGSAVHRYKLLGSSEKHVVIDKLQAFLDQMCLGETSVMRALTVADEFIMNALYDAPTDVGGRHLYADAPRTRAVELTDNQAIEVAFGSDGRSVAISTRDTFGSLNTEAALLALARCLRGDEDQIVQGAGGAGIGLYMAYQYMDELVINVSHHSATEVIGILKLQTPRREAVRPKSLSIFIAATTP